MKVQVGDIVKRTPILECKSEGKPRKGTVVWVHPKGRFHTVQFYTAFYSYRQCFMGVEK